MILLRSTLFALWFFGGTLAVTMFGVPVLFMGQTRALRFAQGWADLMLGGLRRICGTRWELTGQEHLPATGPFLIASMHQSAFDTLIWIALAPRIAYVFKRELERIPLFNLYLRATGMISVDRAGGGAAMRALLRETDRAVAESRQIVIFPEGTRVSPGERAALMPGVAAMATRARLPVIPVVTDSGLYWGRRSFLKHPGTIRIAIQPPLSPGLARGEVMEHLAAIFADAPALLRDAVDNSVSDVTARFSDRPS